MGIKIELREMDMSSQQGKEFLKAFAGLSAEEVMNKVVRKVLQKGYREGRTEVVRKPWLDMEIQYCVPIVRSEGRMHSVVVTDNFLQNFHISKDDLDKACEKNENTGGWSAFNVFEYLNGRISSAKDINDQIEMSIAGKGPITLAALTNREMVNGANCLLHLDLLKKVAEAANTEKVLVIPSSIHEILVAPFSDNIDLDSMREMVHMINSNEVAPEERLSESVYIYDAVKNTLEIAQ